MAWSDVQAAFDFKGECSADAISVLRVLAYKVWKRGYAYCGADYIAQAIRRRSRKTVHTAINELIERGYIYRLSGRYGGVRNVYFINIPGALAVNNPVYQEAVKQIQATGVCKLRPYEMGNPRQVVCRPGAKRCVNDAPEEGNIENNKSDPPMSCEDVLYTPPPGPVRRTAPVDTPEFRRQALQICIDVGASPSEAARFCEINQADKWAVLEHFPLEIAAQRYVAEWKERDIRAWSTEQISRIKKKLVS